MSDFTTTNKAGRTTGRFEKRFSRFVDGLNEMALVSRSVGDSLGTAKTEEEAVIRLARNVMDDAPTGNGVDWNRCALSIAAHEVNYRTVGGLCYGWHVDKSDYQHVREDSPEGGNNWLFYIVHPQGPEMRPDSSLRQSALAAGWEEVLDFKVISTGFNEADDAVEGTFQSEAISRAKRKIEKEYLPFRETTSFDDEDNEDEALLGKSTLAKLRARKPWADNQS